MRLRNLTAIPIAVVVLPALVSSAGASAKPAFKPRSLAGGCRIGLHVAPRRIAAGDGVLAYGRLVCQHHADAGQTVSLFEHTFGTAGYTAVGSATTDPGGFYELPVSGLQSNSSFYAAAGGATSTQRQVRVEALVTLNGPPPGSQLLTGRPNKVKFTGSVSPADEGAEVILQRQNAITGNEWRWIGRGVVGPGGNFTIEHTFIVPGDANIRVRVRSQGRNVPSSSNELTYEISQAQNPRLMINASPNPILYGQTVTISGFAPGLANQPVTLFSRVRHQHGFAPVTETTTNTQGEYTFPAQSPSTSTFYRVVAKNSSCTGHKGACAGALIRSAVLFEGVKDILTASVSPSGPVQAGQALTFSGTVTPEQTGHIIYLERQNASGNGFHVVKVSLIGAGSSYSLTYTIYTPGTSVFRVRIPGGPNDEGAVSQPFTIQVTPAPAAALKTEAPGNTSLPSEGSERSGEERETGEENEIHVPKGEGSAGGPRHRGRHGR